MWRLEDRQVAYYHAVRNKEKRLFPVSGLDLYNSRILVYRTFTLETHEGLLARYEAEGDTEKVTKEKHNVDGLKLHQAIHGLTKLRQDHNATNDEVKAAEQLLLGFSPEAGEIAYWILERGVLEAAGIHELGEQYYKKDL
jgi:hypothetical protein